MSNTYVSTSCDISYQFTLEESMDTGQYKAWSSSFYKQMNHLDKVYALRKIFLHNSSIDSLSKLHKIEFRY